MPTKFDCGILLRGSVAKPEAARRLAGCLPVFTSRGLAPQAFLASAWRDASPRVFGGTGLLHAEYVGATGNPFWGAGFTLVPAPEADATLVMMTTPARLGGAEGDAWQWTIGLAEEVCDAIGADLALINGFAMRRDGRSSGGTSAGPDVAPGHPPRVLFPWMYWGAARLAEDETSARLGGLTAAAFRSSPSPGGGWVLQAYESYDAEPPAALIAAYAAAFDVPAPHWVATR